MAAVMPRDKYYLRSLHEEIALYDRKLAHLMKYETFASEKERNAAAAKISVKRGQLIKNAQVLIEEGIEFKPADLPRSLRPEDLQEAAETSDAAPEVVHQASPTESPATAVFDGSKLDFRQEIKEYMLNRRKQYVPSN